MKFATTGDDDVQTRTQMWMSLCQVEISANAAEGGGGTASPQSHLTPVENVLLKVNSARYYSAK